MYTSVMLLALSQAVGALIPTPEWNSDYRLAMQLGEKAQKPLAVFIGSGKGGWSDLSKEGELSSEVRKLLADKYICLYVDKSTSQGKVVAASFEAGQQPKLVISDRSGRYQAYRHSGTLEHAELESVLKRHAAGDVPVSVAQAAEPVQRQSYYQPSNYAPAMSNFGGGACRT